MSANYNPSASVLAACAPALAAMRAALACGTMPNVAQLARTHGVKLHALKAAYRLAGLKLQSGRRAASKRGAKITELEDGTTETRPPLAELEDACARWGLDGAAEEYEVDEATICRWLREIGVEDEMAGRRPNDRPPAPTTSPAPKKARKGPPKRKAPAARAPAPAAPPPIIPPAPPAPAHPPAVAITLTASGASLVVELEREGLTVNQIAARTCLPARKIRAILEGQRV